MLIDSKSNMVYEYHNHYTDYTIIFILIFYVRINNSNTTLNIYYSENFLLDHISNNIHVISINNLTIKNFDKMIISTQYIHLSIHR